MDLFMFFIIMVMVINIMKMGVFIIFKYQVHYINVILDIMVIIMINNSMDLNMYLYIKINYLKYFMVFIITTIII